MNKLDANRTGLATAITAAVISVACLLLVLVLPWPMVMYGYSSMFHMGAPTASMSINGLSALVGLALITIVGYAAGSIFAVVYNKLK